MEILFLGAIILVALVLFVTELFPIDVTALLVLGLLLILGLVSPTESLAGFSNPAVITNKHQFFDRQISSFRYDCLSICHWSSFCCSQ